MELVSERSKKDIAADLALSQAEEALRRFAANLMRIAADAGKSYEPIQIGSSLPQFSQ